MEYGLWGFGKKIVETEHSCLNPCFNGIWSLRTSEPKSSGRTNPVLILVLMEYGLWEIKAWKLRFHSFGGCLNPCFNGIWSLSNNETNILLQKVNSLNPCFNGIWSLRIEINVLFGVIKISLNPCFNGIWSLSASVGWLTLLSQRRS